MYPYLLKGLAIDRPNQVWSADITYIPVQRGFLYLVAISWTGPPAVCSPGGCPTPWMPGSASRPWLKPWTGYGRPEIFNTDQGSHFTSFEFTAVLKNAGVAISMDGRGRCMDNIFIERLWRSMKYEAVYLHELPDGFEAQRVIARWIDFYNTQRPHSALADSTPVEAYQKGMLMEMQAEPRRSPAPLPAQPDHEDVLNSTLAA